MEREKIMLSKYEVVVEPATPFKRGDVVRHTMDHDDFILICSEESFTTKCYGVRIHGNPAMGHSGGHGEYLEVDPNQYEIAHGKITLTF
jgi:hypothetical protein